MNRHFVFAMIASACVPILGFPIVWALGQKYEEWHPSPDKEQDLENNWNGALWGQIIGLVLWTIVILPK